MSSDMLTAILSNSDVKSETITWRDRRTQIAEDFIKKCTWRCHPVGMCKATDLECKLINIDKCAVWNIVKHTLI